ncbi:hypothetical protein D9M71_547740 [compost metagenome]
MVRVPKVPTITVPLVLLVPAGTSISVPGAVSRRLRMPVTVRASPLSTSVSLASTLPTASLPGVPLSTPPASVAEPSSSTPTGVSLAPWMVTVRVETEVRPPRSEMV